MQLLVACCSLLVLTLSSLVRALESSQQYRPGHPVPVSCVNRKPDTGEHVTDSKDRIEYVPFPVCSETGKPLELYFGIEGDVNCTIDFIDDPFFHILEFYVHNDAPMTCRIPARPISLVDPTAGDPSNQVGVLGTEDARYVPMVVALNGILQSTHVHVSNNLNVLVHASPKSVAPGVIDSATAYSVSHLTRNTEIFIGGRLPLRFSVRWYPSPSLPSGWAGVGGHLYATTLLYCLLSAGAATALSIAYYRGIALPKRLKSHGYERAFASDRGRYTGYGYGVGNGYGYASTTATGKID